MEITKTKENKRKDGPPNTNDMRIGDVAELDDSSLFPEINHKYIVMGQFNFYMVENPDVRWPSKEISIQIKEILPRGTILKIVV